MLVALELRCRSIKDLRRAAALGLQGAEAASEDGLTDQGDRHAEIQRVDGSPLAGTLLTGRVENLLKQRGAIIIIELHDIAGDLDEERVENAVVPLVKDVTHLAVRQAKTALHDVVRLQCKVSLKPATGPPILRAQSNTSLPRRSAACHRTRCRCGPS